MKRDRSIWWRKVREWPRSEPAGGSIPHIFGAQKHGAVRRAGHERVRSSVCSAAAEVAQVDHRVGQGLERIVDVGNGLVAHNHAPKFVLPSEHALNGAKPLFVDVFAEQALGAGLGGFPAARVLIDVGNHVAVEDRFAVGLAVVNAVQADGAPSKIQANGLGNTRQLWQCFTQQGGLVSIARCSYERRDRVAVAVAKRHGFIALEVFVATEANVVASLLGDCRRAVTVKNRGVEQIAVEKRLHRAGENGIDVALACPPAKGTVNAGVVDFGLSIAAICNWQRFPLAPHVELLQDVVENLVQRQFDRWPSAPTLQVRQDKCLKLLETQTRWNPLPMLALRHFACQSRRILTQLTRFPRTQCSCGLATDSGIRKTRNQLLMKEQCMCDKQHM